MKLFSIIFAFYILFLGLEPGISAMRFPEEQPTSCCNDESCLPIEKPQPKKNQDKKDNGSKCTCNPFLTCSNCVPFTSDFVCINISPITAFSQQHTVSNDKVPSAIALDFWQPPKIV